MGTLGNLRTCFLSRGKLVELTVSARHRRLRSALCQKNSADAGAAQWLCASKQNIWEEAIGCYPITTTEISKPFEWIVHTHMTIENSPAFFCELLIWVHSS